MEPDSKINCCQMNAIPWKWKFLLEEYHQIRLNHWKISPSDEVGLALLEVLKNCKSPCREINQSCFLQYFDMSQCYVMYVEAALSNYDSGSTYFESICHIWKFTRKVTDIYVTTISNYFIDHQKLRSQITWKCTALGKSSAIRI